MAAVQVHGRRRRTAPRSRPPRTPSALDSAAQRAAAPSARREARSGEAQLHRDRDHASRRSSGGDHALLPPDRRRSSAPASRSSTRSRPCARGPTNERFRERAPDIAEQIQAGAPFSEALGSPPRRVPELLHRHPALGRDHRSARRRARPAVRATSSATSRRARSSSPRSTYPAIVLVMSIVTVIILVALRAAEVHRVLQGVRRRSCRCRRGCCWTSPTSSAVVVR